MGTPNLILAYDTRNFLTFVKTTAIAYGLNLESPGNYSPIKLGNCSRFYKRQEITSIGTGLREFLLVL